MTADGTGGRSAGTALAAAPHPADPHSRRADARTRASAGLPRFGRVLGPVLRSPEQGADTLVYLVAHDEPTHSTGELWRDRRRRWEHRVPWTRHPAEEEARLWEWLTVRHLLAQAA